MARCYPFCFDIKCKKRDPRDEQEDQGVPRICRRDSYAIIVDIICSICTVYVQDCHAVPFWNDRHSCVQTPNVNSQKMKEKGNKAGQQQPPSTLTPCSAHSGHCCNQCSISTRQVWQINKIGCGCLPVGNEASVESCTCQQAGHLFASSCE